MLATDMGAGQTKLMAQEVTQQGARLNRSFVVIAVHRDFQIE
jgi:hypothetical protein